MLTLRSGHLAIRVETGSNVNLTRRSFLGACLGATGVPVWAIPAATRLKTALGVGTDPLRAWHMHLAQSSRGSGAPFSADDSQALDLSEFPWAAMRQLLRSRFPDLRRHFAFEYYPWYANDPFRHWQQWDREPPTDLAASSMPLLGAYDSRSAAVIEQHASWITESGVGVVNLSWWGPGSFSDRAVSLVMDVMNAHDIRVTFFLEPYRQRVELLSSDIQYLLREYGDKRGWDCFFLHQWADGARAPVFKLFATTLFPQTEDCHGVIRDVPAYRPDREWRQATDQVRQALAGAFPRVTLLSTDIGNHQRVQAAGFDGSANYDPGQALDTWLDRALDATQQGVVFSFNANAGQDEIERRNLPSDSCLTTRPFVPGAPLLDWSRSEDRERAKELAEQRIRESVELGLLLQTHPWLGNSDAGFFLTYITSFNEWHEGTQFEPMKADAALTSAERAVGYHNPQDGFYRLQRLTEILGRLLG